MAKWTLDRAGTWDYDLLGFTASQGDVLEADFAPDAYWSAAAGDPTESVTRWDMTPDAPRPYAETVDGAPLVYDATKNRFVASSQSLSDTLNQSDQVDFVDLVVNHGPRYGSMNVLKIGDNRYKIRLDDGSRGVVYEINKDLNDDFIKVNECSVGFDPLAVHSFSEPSTDDLTGSWSTGSSSWYTTQVGATISQTVVGSQIDVWIGTETRGGLWTFEVDGVETAQISCYSSGSFSNQRVTIATGLDPDAEHAVVGTYSGDDPANPPSSNPSRGYIKLVAPKDTFTGYAPGASAETTVFANLSNKEMAFSASKDGNNNWIPEHNSEGSAFQITPPSFYIDGKPVDLASEPIGTSVPITRSFRFDQHFNGQIIGLGDAYEFHTTTAFSPDGAMDFDGTKRTLMAGTEITGYPMMIPGDSVAMDTFISGIGTEAVNLADESKTYFVEESDSVYSACVVSTANSAVIGAGTLKNPRLTYRRKKVGKAEAGKHLFLWNRAANPKVYFQAAENWSPAIGDVYAWGFRMVVAEIDEAYQMARST